MLKGGIVPIIVRCPYTRREQKLRALIDTGSTYSCIEESVVQQLQLNVVEQDVSLRHQAGSSVSNLFLVEIEIAALGLRELTAVITGPVSSDKHDALLGRAQLQSCLLSYDGPHGSVRLSR